MFNHKLGHSCHVALPTQLKYSTPYNPATPRPGIGNKCARRQEISSIVHCSKNKKQPTYSSTGKWIMELWHIQTVS